MTLTLTKVASTLNTQYKCSKDTNDFSINVQQSEDDIQNISGSIIKNDGSNTSIGYFNKYIQGQLNITFEGTTAEKQALVADIDEIINQLTETE